MELTNFSIDQLNNYSMWFMLDKIKQGPISLVRRTPAGDEQFLKFKCFKMNDGHILLGINNFISFTAKHNLYAIADGVEEVVNIQMFENIMNVYDVPVDGKDKGFFVFSGSTVIALEEEWRCDNTRFGPMGFNVIENVEEAFIHSFSEILVYETIFSVEGVGHLFYIQHKNHDEQGSRYVNAATLPFTGSTISEALKLITEWAVVNEEPFSNTQPISNTAKEFLNKLDFDWSLVEYQTDMYVAEFIKGNPNARVRPSTVQPLNAALDLFIKKKMAYRCLSALVSLYPDSWNLQEIIDNEKQALDSIHNGVLFVVEKIDKPFAVYIVKQNIQRTMELHNKLATTGIF